MQRLEAWLAAELGIKAMPLMLLSEASELSGLARGLAYQLTENLGVLRREAAAAEIKALDQEARAQLRKYGVRFGAFNVYIPSCSSRPRPIWCCCCGRCMRAAIMASISTRLPARPQQGLTSVEAGTEIPEPYWRAAGFHVAGSRAVRIDMLERLSDLIRARIAFRPAEGSEAPAGATGDGGFRVVPELMSVVGCSGEEFASILKALGFRRERRPLAPAEAVEVEAPDAASGAEAIAIDEIWRPGRRRAALKDKGWGHKPQRPQRAKGPKRERPQRQPPRVEAERKRVEHSPFAALAVLKGRLATRQPEGN